MLLCLCDPTIPTKHRATSPAVLNTGVRSPSPTKHTRKTGGKPSSLNVVSKSGRKRKGPKLPREQVRESGTMEKVRAKVLNEREMESRLADPNLLMDRATTALTLACVHS